MSWTAPTLVEVCIGLEINGYLPPEFWSVRGRGRGSRPAAQSRLSWDQRWRLVIRAIACGRTSGNR